MKDPSVEHFSDLDTAWSWVVMVAAFVAQFVIGGTNFTVGLVHVVLLEKYGASQADTAWASALYTSISNFGAPLASVLVDRFSLRSTVVLSGVLYTLGFIGTAFADSLIVSILTFGVIAGLGGAVGWTSSTVATNFYFMKYRGIAQGFALAGVGAGMFGLPQLVLWSSDQNGSFGFFMGLAAVGIQLIVCGTAMWQSKLEKYTQMKRRQDHKDESNSCMVLAQHYSNVIKSCTVICLSLSTFLLCSGLYSVFVYLPYYISELCGSSSRGSFLLSICGMCSIFARFGIGAIANTNVVKEIYLHCICLAFLAINTLTFPFVSEYYSAQIVFAVVTGLFFGGPFVLLAPTNIRFLGMDKMLAATSLEICMCGVGGIVGPTIAGKLSMAGATFEQIFLLAGGMFTLSAIVCILPVCLVKQDGQRPAFAADINKEIEVVKISQPLLTEYAEQGRKL